MPEGEFHGPEKYRKYMEIAAKREGVEPEIVYIEVPKAGGSFHHGWTWHDEQGIKKPVFAPVFLSNSVIFFGHAIWLFVSS